MSDHLRTMTAADYPDDVANLKMMGATKYLKLITAFKTTAPPDGVARCSMVHLIHLIKQKESSIDFWKCKIFLSDLPRLYKNPNHSHMKPKKMLTDQLEAENTAPKKLPTKPKKLVHKEDRPKEKVKQIRFARRVAVHRDPSPDFGPMESADEGRDIVIGGDGNLQVQPAAPRFRVIRTHQAAGLPVDHGVPRDDAPVRTKTSKKIRKDKAPPPDEAGDEAPVEVLPVVYRNSRKVTRSTRRSR